MSHSTCNHIHRPHIQHLRLQVLTINNNAPSAVTGFVPGLWGRGASTQHLPYRRIVYLPRVAFLPDICSCQRFQPLRSPDGRTIGLGEVTHTDKQIAIVTVELEARRFERCSASHIVQTICSQLTARYWIRVAVLTVQFVPHRKHTPSP
jgi:hypothetical protein